MTAFDFFIEILSFIGTIINDLLDNLFTFSPVNIVLSILIGVIVLSIVFGIIRGRKM